MAKVGELFVDLTFKSDNAVATISNMITKIGLLQFGLSQIRNGFEKVFGETLKTGVELRNFNAQTDFSVEKMQRWKAIAEQNGVAFDSLIGAFKTLQQNRAEMLVGGGNVSPYAMLGIDPRQDPLKVFDQIREKISVLDKGLQRWYLGQFGLSEDLMTIFSLSNDELNNYNSSLALTAEEVKDLTSLNQEWKGLTQDLGMVWDKFIANISPSVGSFLGDLRDIISMFNELSNSVDFAAEGIIKSIDKISSALEERLKNNSVIKFLHGLGGGWVEQGTNWLLKNLWEPYYQSLKKISQERKKEQFLEYKEKYGDSIYKNPFFANKFKDIIKNNADLSNYDKSINKDIIKNNSNLMDYDKTVQLAVKDIALPSQSLNQDQRTISVGDTYYNINTSGTNLTEQDVAELTRQGNENLINSIINNR